MSRSWFPGKPRKSFQKTRLSLSVSQNNEIDLETNQVENKSEVISTNKQNLIVFQRKRKKFRYRVEQKRNQNWKLKQKRKTPDNGSSKSSLILEKARLNCINHTESSTNKIPGPFSSNSGAQSLLNHFSNNSTFLKKKLSSVTCSVCSAIQVFRHAKHVRNAFHFQVNTCNFCKLFLRKMIHICRNSSAQSLSCSKDNGMCSILPICGNQSFDDIMSSRCQACWLKTCLNQFPLAIGIRSKLISMLPNCIQLKFSAESKKNSDRTVMSIKRNSDSDGGNFTKDGGSSDEEAELPSGPRYKNVCRSALTALGRPLIATFETTQNASAKSKPVKNNENYGVILPKKTYCKKQMISINYWENYDLDEVYNNGFGLIFSDGFNIKSLCFLCGSAGDEELIYCANCCEPYHLYCVNDNNYKSTNNQNNDPKWKLNWLCKRCIPCHFCEKVTRNKVQCQKCLKSFHMECFNSTLGLNSDHSLVCSKCLKCNSCGNENGLKFVGHTPYCLACFRLRKKGNFCPICQGCYENNDYDTMMIECNTCKHWVHATCEQISDDEYYVLSNLPDSIEYICLVCAKKLPTNWKLVLKNGFMTKLMNVLKCLSKNRTVRPIFKWSPISNKVSEHRDFMVMEVSKLIAKKSLFQNENTSNFDEVNDLHLNSIENNYDFRNQEKSSFLSIRSKINDQKYMSLKEFQHDVETALRDIHENSNLIQCFRRILKEHFPWHYSNDESKILTENFNEDKTIKLTNNCFNKLLNDEMIKIDEFETCLEIPINALEKYVVFDDNDNHHPQIDSRICLFCKGLGDRKQSWEGRLLYCAYNEWVHANCALWSAEVYEEIDGSLQNVHSAITRGRSIKCSFCTQKGASIGCCAKNCFATYHFSCARLSNCYFMHDKTVYCKKHATTNIFDSKQIVVGNDFNLDRPVFIELFESLSQQQSSFKKRKLVDASDVHVIIGSLSIHKLGNYHSKCSDFEDAIVPVDFECTRLYWSTVYPWKIVPYSIKISLIEYPKESKSLDLSRNFVVDHTLPQQLVQEQLTKIAKFHQGLKKSNISVNETYFENDFYDIDKQSLNYFYNNKKCLLQVDGNDDDSNDSDGSIICVFDRADNHNVNSENPVTCTKCQCTYRTKISYDRHLSTCFVPVFDFSSDENDDSNNSNCSINSHHDTLNCFHQENVASSSKQVHVQSSNDSNNNQRNITVNQGDVTSQQANKKLKCNDSTSVPVPVSLKIITSEVAALPQPLLEPQQQQQHQPIELPLQSLSQPQPQPQSPSPIQIQLAQLQQQLPQPQSQYIFMQPTVLSLTPQQIVPIQSNYYNPNLLMSTNMNQSSEIMIQHNDINPYNLIQSQQIPILIQQPQITNQIQSSSQIQYSLQPPIFNQPFLNLQSRSSPIIDQRRVIIYQNTQLSSSSQPLPRSRVCFKNNTTNNSNYQPSRNCNTLQKSNNCTLANNSQINSTTCKVATLNQVQKSDFKTKISPILTNKVLPVHKPMNRVLPMKQCQPQVITAASTINNSIPLSIPAPTLTTTSINHTSEAKILSEELITKPLNIDNVIQNSHLNNNNNSNSGINIINEIVTNDLENGYHDFDKENDKNFENCLVTNNNVGVTTNFEDDDLPKLLYEISTSDAEYLNFKSTSFTEIWTKITDLVQKARVKYGLKSSSLSINEQNQLSNCFDVLGLKSNQVRFLLEQLSGANKSQKYRRRFDSFFKNIDNNKCNNNNNNSSSLASYVLPDDQSDVDNHVDEDDDDVDDDDADVNCDTDNSKTTSRCNYFIFKPKSTDIFSWLTSKHRVAQFSSTITRKKCFNNNSISTTYNNYRQTTKSTKYIGVYPSLIHGLGLFCLQDIECSEMVVQYTGEIVRSSLTDKREKLYSSRGIGCYMFRIDDNLVIDATMCGNAARFINHSCEPNCYSKVVEIFGNKQIFIFALRKIYKGEELTYDYKFPLEEDKIPCSCSSKKCRRYLN